MKTFEDKKEKLLTEQELSNLQKAYRSFFQGKLKEYDVESPAQLDKEKMSEFFNEIKSDWPAERSKVKND